MDSKNNKIQPLLTQAKLLSEKDFQDLLVQLDLLWQEREKNDYETGIVLACGNKAHIGDMFYANMGLSAVAIVKVCNIISPRKIIVKLYDNNKDCFEGKDITMTYRPKQGVWLLRGLNHRYAIVRYKFFNKEIVEKEMERTYGHVHSGLHRTVRNSLRTLGLLRS